MTTDRWTIRGVAPEVRDGLMRASLRARKPMGPFLADLLEMWERQSPAASDHGRDELDELRRRVEAVEARLEQVPPVRVRDPRPASVKSIGGARQAYSAEAIARAKELQAVNGWGKRKIAQAMQAEGFDVTENGLVKYLRG